MLCEVQKQALSCIKCIRQVVVGCKSMLFLSIICIIKTHSAWFELSSRPATDQPNDPNQILQRGGLGGLADLGGSAEYDSGMTLIDFLTMINILENIDYVSAKRVRSMTTTLA